MIIMNKTIRLLSLFLVMIFTTSVFAGCSDDKSYDNYSYGLTNEGIYENLDAHDISIPDYKSLSLTCDEVLEWGAEAIREGGRDDIKTIDDYVYAYGEDFLFGLGVTKKDVADEGDVVSASLVFHIGDKHLTEFDSTDDYKTSSDGDSIVSSFIGHKVNDEYEVQYTFDKSDPDYANQTATVKVVIKGIVSSAPIKEGMVDSNLEAIAKYLDGVTDTQSFLVALRPAIAESILPDFVRYWVLDSEWTVPDEFIDYEMYRLKARLQKIGYTYKEYLKAINITDEEARKSCESLAKENVFAMIVYEEMNLEITDDDLQKRYGDNVDYLIKAQGAPYLRLSIMRDFVWATIHLDVELQGVDRTHNKTENTEPTQPTTNN